MKDSKTLLLLIVSLLLLLASITLLWSWGYQFSFNHKDPPPQNAATPAKQTGKADTHVSDSLQKIYYATLDHLDRTIDSVYNHTDSLKGNLDVKLAEFYQLRTQITELFKNRAGDADVKLASEKILQLQQRIVQLRISNTDVENENKRLSVLLNQYIDKDKKSNTAATAIPAPAANNTALQERTAEIKPLPVRTVPVTAAADFSAADLQLTAWAEDDGKDRETFKADEAEKLSGTFTVKNTGTENNNAEIIVVVLQPDGKVMQKSSWESGAFQTNAGKKIYSCKLFADCAAGETRRLHFSLAADQYQKGTYTLQVYHNGSIIARITKSLS